MEHSVSDKLCDQALLVMSVRDPVSAPSDNAVAQETLQSFRATVGAGLDAMLHASKP
jgi:hypothetical protein